MKFFSKKVKEVKEIYPLPVYKFVVTISLSSETTERRIHIASRGDFDSKNALSLYDENGHKFIWYAPGVCKCIEKEIKN